VTVAREEVDQPIVDVVGHIYGGHLVELSGMSSGIKGLTEVQHDDHYIRVAREQFCNRLENADKSCSRGSSWTESIWIRAAQVDGRLENCWINELSDEDTFECSAQDGSYRNRSKVKVFLWRSGLGNRCNSHRMGTVEVQQQQ